MDALARMLKSNLAGLVAALALAAILAVNASAAFPYQFGIDFYQFWGVPVARAVSAPGVSPYADPPGYARTLNAISDASDNEKLHHANHFRRNLEPMGTPLLYAAFAAFPADYESAQLAFTVLLYLASGLGVFILARLRGVAPWPALCIAMLVELTFNPFIQDVKVGNVNSLQLAFMAVLLHVAVKRRYTGNAAIDGLFIGMLAVFVIFKPNTPWIALAFAIHYWVVRGHRQFFAGVGMAALLAALAFAAGAWYFKDASIWQEWFRFARGMDGSGLPLTLAQGNQSLAMLLAGQSLSTGPVAFGVIIASALALALLVVASHGGRRPELLLPGIRDAFANPWFAASIGVLFTLATSPLLWPHYLVLALVPMAWLFWREGRADLATWGALICYCALSRPLLDILVEGGFYGLIQATMLLAWLPLIPGVYAHAAGRPRVPA